MTDDETSQPTTHDEPIDGDELTDEERRVLANVAGILRKIKYGTVVLVVQDGKVVQIEMAEKFRLR
ncbi:MAG: putative small protein [Actinomycetia bacterium]|nr:putative small protein [Actinomycetes bacterium]